MQELVSNYLKCRHLKDKCGSNQLYLGPPGIGKSETVIRAAEIVASELGLKVWEYENATEPEDYEKTFVLVLFRLDMVKPEDLSGFPLPNKSEGTFDYAVPRWAKVLRKAKAGLVVLDEFTNVNDDTLLSAAYDIILSEKVNLFYFKKPVIALGNPPEHSSLARPLPLPLLNRLAVFKVREPSIELWHKYMDERYGDSWAKEVGSFLKAFSQMFLKLPEDVEDLEPFPTPRSWSSLALALFNAYQDLYKALKERDEKAKKDLITLVSAYVGREAAHAFVEWAYSDVPPLEEIFKNPKVLLEMDSKRSLVAIQSLANYSHVRWKSKITKVINELIKDPNGARYVAMILRFMTPERRKELINYLKTKNRVLLFEIKKNVGGGELFWS